MFRKLIFGAVFSVLVVGSAVGQTALSLVGYGTGEDGVEHGTFPGLNVQYHKEFKPYFDFSWINGNESKLFWDYISIDVGYTFAVGDFSPLSITSFIGVAGSIVCPDFDENKKGCSDNGLEEDWTSIGFWFAHPVDHSWKTGLKAYFATSDGGVLQRGDVDVEIAIMHTNLFNKKYSFRASYRFRRHGNSGGEGYLESLYPRITLMFGKVF